MLTFGSLFAGIGGFDLGFERAGMHCAWSVEIDDRCNEVRAHHWPDVRQYKDVKDVGRNNLEPVDVICGGFPCQDISHAGKREGITGKRSGLWSEFYRIICELRPRYVLVENVAALLNRGMGVVLGDLAACGYDAEWQSLPAAAFGAPHIRDRCFILAYTASQQRGKSQAWNGRQVLTRRTKEIRPSKFWTSEPDICRVVNGFPGRVDRCTTLGNAVVPQIAEWIGRRIIELDT